MEFQQIRGATVKITYGSGIFLVDPFFAAKDEYPPLEAGPFPDKRWPTVNLPMSIEEIISGIDAIIVTHLHPDHLDEFAVKALPKDIPLFVQDETDATVIRQYGFEDVRVLNYCGTKFGYITMYRIDCLHGHPETTQKYYDAGNLRETASGVVFEADNEKTFYLAGDTIWYEKVDEAIKKYRPEIIAVNGADAQFADSGSIIMGLDDILQVCKAAPEAKIIVTHLDAVPHALVGRKEVNELIAQHKLFEQIVVPDDGEVCHFEGKE